MIKVATAHPRITIVATLGVTSVVAGSILGGFSPTEAVLNTGNSISHVYKYAKAAGVISAFIGIIFILFKFKIIGWMMAPENSAFMVARRGILVRDKTGNVVLHDSGRNRAHVANYRHLVPVHFGDRYVELGRHEFMLRGVTWKADFTLRWRIPKDKKRIERIVTAVSDRNWWDGEFNQLTRAVKDSAAGQLGSLLKEAQVNKYNGLPEIDQESAAALIGAAIDPYGGKFYELLVSPISLTDAQQGKDGNVAIANAIQSISSPKRVRTILRWLVH